MNLYTAEELYALPVGAQLAECEGGGLWTKRENGLWSNRNPEGRWPSKTMTFPKDQGNLPDAEAVDAYLNEWLKSDDH